MNKPKYSSGEKGGIGVARLYGARTASRAYRDHARQRRRTFLRGSVRWGLYTVIAILLCVLEGTLFTFRGASVSAIGTPYLLPAWVTAVAMQEGAVGGAWFGIAIGLLSSSAGGDALYVLPLLFMFYGLCIGLLGTRFLKKGFLIYTVYETAVCALHGGILLLISFISALIAGEGPGAVFPLLWRGALSDMIASAIWSLPLYLLMLPLRRLTVGNSEEHEPPFL